MKPDRVTRRCRITAHSLLMVLLWMPLLATAQDGRAVARSAAVTTAEKKPVPQAVSHRIIEEIIVTSERRSQNLQDVVGGIQAFTGSSLENAGAAGFKDYLAQIPGAGFRQDGSGAAKIGLRGISNISGNQLGTFSGASPVGIYLDDVPIQGSGILPDLDLYDLKRVEVLKGPQGTLYGEGSMGGTIRMIVNPPQLAESDIKAETGLSGTEDGGLNESFKVAGGTPIITDTLAVRGVGVVKHDSGFIDLPNQNRKDANAHDAKSLRLSSDWQITPKLSANLLLLKDLSDLRGSGNVRPDTEDQLSNDIYENEFSHSNIDIDGLTLKYDFAGAQLTSVSSYLHAQRHAVFRLGLFRDLIEGNVAKVVGPLGVILDPNLITGIPFDLLQIKQEPFDDQTLDVGFAQELRLVSTGGGRFNWITGLYYQQLKQHYDQTSFIYQSPIPGENRQLHRDGYQPLRQIAAYGQGTYTLLPPLDLTLGLRVAHQTIGIHDFLQTYGVVAIAEAATFDTNPKRLDISKDYTTFLPKASLSWHLSEDAMIYGLVSRGFRAATPNVQAQLGVGPPLLKPDTTWNYEVGTKTQWWDRRLTVNASLYLIDWQNLQASRQGQGNLGPAPITVIYIDNIGDAQIRGAELDLQLAPGAGFRFGLAGAYTDSRLVKVDSGSVAIKGSRVPNSPKFSGSFSAGYGTPILDDLNLSLETTLQYVGDQASLEVTETDPTGSQTRDYTKLGAQISVDSAHWRLTVFGDNLLNDTIELQNATLVASEHFITLGRPRTVGLRLQVHFGGA